MKTITFQGTEEQISKVLQPLSLLPVNQIDFMQKALRSNLNNLQVETRVYVVNYNETEDEDLNIRALTDEDFMTEAERQGTVFTLETFQNQINHHDFYMDESYIRFINVPI